LEDGPETGLWRKIANFLNLRQHKRKPLPADIEKELQQLIDAGEEEGLISEDEGEMIQSIFTFGDTVAREIMVPRTDAVLVGVETTIQDLLQLIIEKGHSRIPVFSGNIDNIIGILHVKDLLAFWRQPDVNLQNILRTPYFIPETKKISHLLKELRAKKLHMAVVIDEYGGTSGLVTIEDIIEEIIGEIQDEYDSEDVRMTSTAEGDLLVDARLEIEKLAEHFNMQVPEGDFESVGGFIISLLDRVPQPQETIIYAPIEMVIESADARKIGKVRVRIHQEDQHPEGSAADN
jgi:magnesium and cobalt transporter